MTAFLDTEVLLVISSPRDRCALASVMFALAALCLLGMAARPAPVSAAPTVMTQSPGAFANSGSLDSERAFAGAKYIGAGTIRHIVQNDVGFTWASTDALVTDTANHGLYSFLTLTYRPYAYGGRRIPTTADMASFCSAAATRYGSTITDYSVFNEPNAYTYKWGVDSTPDHHDIVHAVPAVDYGEMYRACYSAIKAADPTSRVYFGELSNGTADFNPCNYVSNALTSSVTRADGVAIHPYQLLVNPLDKLTGAACRGIGRISEWGPVLASASTLRTPAGGAVPLAVTEFGYCRSSSAKPCDEPGAPGNETQRASWLDAAYDNASAAGATYFNYYHLAPGDNSWDTGIMNADGSVTDSMNTLRAKTGSTWESGYVRTGGATYRIVGGAPIRIYDCTNLPGCSLAKDVPNLSGYASVPANGTFVRIEDGPAQGQVARVVGGAMVPVGAGNCGALNGCSGMVALDHQGFDAYAAAHPDIASGTLVRQATGPGASQITRSVGGALLVIGTCSYLNGCAGWVDIDEGGLDFYNARHKNVADGTFVRQVDGAAAGQVTRVAGGVRMAINNCTTIGGCPTDWVNIDEYALSIYDAHHKAMADGTYVRQNDGGAAGQVSRAVGGALLPMQTCPGTCSWVQLDEQAIGTYNATHKDIADGTFVRQFNGAAAGQVTRVAGGVRMAINNCTTIGGCPTDWVNIDQYGLDAYDAHHKAMADGTYVRQTDGGAAGQVSRAVGGFLIPLATCPTAGCGGVAVGLAEASLNAYRSTHTAIADGTFVRQADGAAAGEITRAAGGALVSLTDCAPLGNCAGRVDVDQAGIAWYRSTRPKPANGTVLKAVPSNGYWLITDGQRTPTSATSSAVIVNDGTLADFPVA